MIEVGDDAWRGTEPRDVEGFLRAYAEEAYAITRVKPAKCDCGSVVFQIEGDADEGAVRGKCVDCGVLYWGYESKDYWVDSKPELLDCPLCGGSDVNVAVGIAPYEHDTQATRWVYIGVRCLGCRCLGCPIEWKLDGDPVTAVETGAWAP